MIKAPKLTMKDIENGIAEGLSEFKTEGDERDD
jgi:hypothetical protein